MANGVVTEFEYDTLNRRTKTKFQDGTFTQTTYDHKGQRTQERDQTGKIYIYGYDGLGRLVSVTDPVNGIGNPTLYTYEPGGNMKTQRDTRGNVTSFTYDAMGRRKTRSLPLGQTETFFYDASGAVTLQTNFNGQNITSSLDPLTDRVEASDGFGFHHEFAYDSVGRRVEMRDQSGATTYRYDSRDRMIFQGSPAGPVTYTYWPGGQIRSMKSLHANGVWMEYEYDTRNLMKQATDIRRPGATTYLFNGVSNLSEVAYSNGVKHQYLYDPQNRLDTLSIKDAFLNTIKSFDYTVGPAGNRTKVLESTGRQVDYGYDDLFRLTSETVSGVSPSGVVNYTFDAVGNRLTRTSSLAGVSAQDFTGMYDANDRLFAPTFDYDANGNTIADSPTAGSVSPKGSGRGPMSPPPQGGGLGRGRGVSLATSDSLLATIADPTFHYDSLNRMTSADMGTGSPVTFIYNGDGHRVARIEGGVRTDYLVDTQNPTGYPQVLEEIQGGVVKVRYEYGLDLISQDRESGGVFTQSFYGFDGQGSTRLLLDSTGSVTDTYDYDAFGLTIQQTGSTPNLFLYTGEQFDPTLGQYYLRARYMNPQFGRFWSRDSYDGQLPSPGSIHSYMYCLNNVVNRTDPSGFEAVDTSEAFLENKLLASAFPATAERISKGRRIRIHLRAFAPWKTFGFGFGGDNRGFSIMPNASSRLNSWFLVEIRSGMVLDAQASSSPSVWGPATGTAIPRISSRKTPSGLAMDVSASNPLIPGAISPDIDLHLKLSFASSTGSSVISVSGSLAGDAFPNAELFAVIGRKETMLLTFGTQGDRNLGPFDLLPGDNQRPMGMFVNQIVAR